jgi:ABC-type transport system involved in cytochrome c biogenesis ATPase subunit
VVPCVDLGGRRIIKKKTEQKRRAALARLLVAFRPLWLLDEPLGLPEAAELPLGGAR